MCRHINGDNVVNLTVFVEFDEYMTLMTIDYQHSIYTSKITFHMFIEVPNPI